MKQAVTEATGHGFTTVIHFHLDKRVCIEKNHVELRKVLPKGTSFDSLTQEKLLLAVNHINSYSRVSLNGKTAFDIAALLFNKSFFEKMGLAKVHPDEVYLTPSLLR